MHILVAPNTFKNSLSAGDAAHAIAKGLQQSRLTCTCECFPVGDGGDGTAGLLIERLGGLTKSVQVHDPLGRELSASFGLIDDGRTAVIEMASASGLRLLSAEELDPLQETSFGTGELIKAALDHGARKILLAIGGSATVDGGVGILQALGVQLLDKEGNKLPAVPDRLNELDSFDLAGLDARVCECEFIVLCDVENPLVGEEGAARVFGPQKGATPEVVEKLEIALTNLSHIIHTQIGREIARIKHGGAAGGVAAGLHAFLNATLLNGIEYFLEVTDFDAALAQADLVVTGEGQIDEQTLQGKAPFGVAARARARNSPVIALAGAVPSAVNESLSGCFDSLFSICAGPVLLETALGQTVVNLERTARELGNLLALRPGMNHLSTRVLTNSNL